MSSVIIHDYLWQSGTPDAAGYLLQKCVLWGIIFLELMVPNSCLLWDKIRHH